MEGRLYKIRAQCSFRFHQHAGRQASFSVLGAVAELERSLIVERVKAGVRNAKAKGKQLGRPKKILDTKRIATLLANGLAHLLTRRREQMTTRSTVAVVCGILAVYLVETLAVLAWA